MATRAQPRDKGRPGNHSKTSFPDDACPNCGSTCAGAVRPCDSPSTAKKSQFRTRRICAAPSAMRSS